MSDLASLRASCEAPLPHPDFAQIEEQTRQVVDWVLQHYQSLPQQSIGSAGSRAEMEALLREPPPEQGQPFDHVLRAFDERVSPHAFRVNHPRFFAFVPGAPSFLSMLGDILCTGSNFFAGVWLEAAGPAQVEILVLDWFREFLGLPDTTQGSLTAGGSEANLIAMIVARDERLAEDECSQAVFYVAEQRHWSIDRAAHIIGMRRDQLRPVPADVDFRLSPEVLNTYVEEDRQAGRLPWLVVANAGATNTGTVDPLRELSRVCREQNLWFHVDAAYGWSAVLCDEGRRDLDGIDACDSITLDPHKWLAQTFDAGCVLVRDGDLLAESFALRPEYLQDVAPREGEINFADHGIALTRRFRALKIWFSMKVLGVEWFRSLVRHCCNLAKYAEALLREHDGFEILSSRQLSIVCFRFVPKTLRGRTHFSEEDQVYLNVINRLIAGTLHRMGEAFLSTTRLHGCVALRFCFVNWRSEAAGVEQTITSLADLGETASI